MENTLYYGDNLDVPRRHIKDETVDLVCLKEPTEPAESKRKNHGKTRKTAKKAV